ncbi:hypothetical protein [Pseudarthrobacter sp. PS3-L1]|uniref:hypothetical protein n=1 Tax=Pseudarthrobacter sp. PS3-L1 TaxID=3046207 RepID=UPI0024BA5B21|nr:hypothetical protein [Pseudarthrobacter sp. PS3-L1]MDJ0321669.1 hypothetical protein [Pseudarthrobacter sp. PS3-L1]
MTTRNLIPWLREKAGLSITSQTIRHYAHKGYLRAVERDPLPTYYPHDVLATYSEHGKETA